MVPPSGSPARAPLAVAAIAVAAVAVRAAPCPYDASADLNSLLDRMEPWADPERGPGPMEPGVQLWPGGVVYYTTSVYDSNVLLILNISIADIESRTATAAGPCIRFEPWSPGVSEDFLFITDQLTNSCCFSSVGRRGGNQTLNIGIKGNNVGNAKHLLMHALGFWHEHSRPGRDADIEVLWDNVTEGLECFFDEYRNETEFVQTDPYDLTSVTHISLNTWARERGQDTLRPRSPTNETDGQMLAYPDDCHKFYKCSGGRDYVCCCPLPLVFSAEESTCDHEWHVPCDTPDQESECPQHHVPDSEQCKYS
ncbi:Zinc metalloproteinase nas-4 [Amphibalanus amphitrite]|uniref:Metalloendopeptidase n=1 Tax=Amphibalanus amphitrite TaxID=1232801 RepID=A0A6A4VEA5_AMPAM|nr:Zinc metalloproteinase nas-4 [Amphibalanus amphitrite]